MFKGWARCARAEQKDVSELGGTMRLGSNPVILQENSLIHQLSGKSEMRARIQSIINYITINDC